MGNKFGRLGPYAETSHAIRTDQIGFDTHLGGRGFSPGGRPNGPVRALLAPYPPDGALLAQGGQMATLIKTTGVEETFTPSGPKFTLLELQALVGGNIEGLQLNHGWWMFIDEEGKLKSKPLNPKATAYADFHGSMILLARDCIVGDAVLVPPDEVY